MQRGVEGPLQYILPWPLEHENAATVQARRPVEAAPEVGRRQITHQALVSKLRVHLRQRHIEVTTQDVNTMLQQQFAQIWPPLVQRCSESFAILVLLGGVSVQVYDADRDGRAEMRV